MSWRVDVRARLGAALSASGPRVLTLSLPAEALDPAVGLDGAALDRDTLSWGAAWAHPDEDATLWLSPEGRRLWGIGQAARLDPREGVAGMRDALAAVPICSLDGEEDPPPPPFFAALPFADGHPMGEPWGPFAPGLLLLPRLCVAAREGETRLWVVTRDPAAEAPWLLHAWDRLCAAVPASPPPERRPEALDLNPSAWDGAIRAALSEIEAGRLQKLVVARRARYRLSRPVDAVGALARLAQTQPRCAIFGVRQAGVCFLGATPERLLLRDGRRLRTDAIAGTHADPAALLASDKDRREHQLVVDGIAAALGPRCVRLDRPAQPDVLQLSQLCHLRTSFEGLLHHDDDALSLAALLHPTPAVGGTPRGPALEAIRAEPAPRGLYAGPVGWVDTRGDGELWVALRSGVLRGQELSLYAGVGVVAGSEPAAEWAETERKLQAMEAVFSP